MRVRTGRNLKKFPLPGAMSKEQRCEMEVGCCLLSAVCCLLSAVCCLLSAICCLLLSAMCCLLSAACCLLSPRRQGAALRDGRERC
jgi:hypothetical protein